VNGYPISDPLRLFSGSVAITSELQLGGAELNAIAAVWGNSSFRVRALAGFRFMDLQESLHIFNPTTDLLLMNTTVAQDRFATRNEFYGGQVGAQLSAERGGLFVAVTGKLALGATRETVQITGSATQTALPGGFAPTPGTFVGGIYALPTNIGKNHARDFSVIPAVELKVGYKLASWATAFVGYDALYWDRVVRPGDEIDRNINPTQSPVFAQGKLVGTPAPQPLFNRSEFWAQGVTFGLEFRY